MTAQAYMPEARIYVGNLNFQLTKEDVRRIFESLGQIVKVEMPAEPGEPSRSRGFAFVHFRYFLRVWACPLPHIRFPLLRVECAL